MVKNRMKQMKTLDSIQLERLTMKMINEIYLGAFHMNEGAFQARIWMYYQNKWHLAMYCIASTRAKSLKYPMECKMQLHKVTMKCVVEVEGKSWAVMSQIWWKNTAQLEKIKSEQNLKPSTITTAMDIRQAIALWFRLLWFWLKHKLHFYVFISENLMRVCLSVRLHWKLRAKP